MTPVKSKRPRTVSLTITGNRKEGSSAKKLKMDEKKANTIIVNVKKVSAEAARRRWLCRHRQLFESLLPSGGSYFDRLEKEAKVSSDKGCYVPLHELDEQPETVTGSMKDYQLHGLSYLVWMYKNGMNCILGDEMGLGKTLQTLSLLAYVHENSKGPRDPHLVVCPLSVLPSWLAEAARWVPSFTVIRFHGTQQERARLKEGIRTGEIQFDVCVTTYDSYSVEDGWFKSRRWTYCVLDEGHKIKNADSAISGKLQGISAMYRLILTGTPVHNNLIELWSLLHWLYPTIFTPTSERQFKDSFDLSRGRYSLPFLTAAQQLLSTVMLRRTKANVEMSVPPREELTVFIPLTESQRFWTLRLLTRLSAVDLEQIFVSNGNKVKKEAGKPIHEGRQQVLAHIQAQATTPSKDEHQWKRLMNLLMQLRKVCDHPYLLPNAEPEPYSIGEHLVASSSKLIAVDKILSDILPKGERVLIFSQWTRCVLYFMALRSIPYGRLDGSTTRPRRALDIKLFQQEKSPYQVFLISTKAGGLGINLTKATTVIMCDSDWNPQNDLQAIARAHRIGQTKTVKVYRLICRGSVEDQMLDRIRRKLFLSVKVMGSDNPSGGEHSGMRSEELMDILRKGSSALERNNDGMDLEEFLDAPINTILEHSRSRETVREAKMKHEMGVKEKNEEENDEKLLAAAEDEEAALLSGVAQVQSRLFDGRLVQRNNKEIAEEWQELRKRQRTNRTVIIDVKPAQKRQRKKYEHEDWCVYCRDGGELVLCSYCPRVFHPQCHGVTKAHVERLPSLTCPQHSCSSCSRNTSDAGGMLFRCQTCTQAFCEDCLPDGDLDAVGDTLPEFRLLGYGESTNAYYIRCQDCHERFEEDPEVWKSWQEEMRETEKKLEAMEL
ncbi:hypothetical protein JAAARDRAFT_63080 [Jaapia argillacea MUCL 33604]|uniref:Uncharacterized protein n=1 Tax=Jaapia argillacea MUCL 33604 TaxID=933084 RepID=A0A067P9V2_9AGAM|nr:hypothetical protein JAAARDRAFT_63080 [Jaapia argillacea MUCL 33604]